MKVALVNFTPMVYTVDTPYQKPLGGSESSLCYLAEYLAKLKHKVILFARVPNNLTSRGVLHIPENEMLKSILDTLDVLIVQNTPAEGPGLRALLPKKTKLVFWTGHAPDQPAIASLSDLNVQNSFDTYVFVSRIHMESSIQAFNLDRKKCLIIRNAISPAFENLFTKGEDILAKKNSPPTLAYNSTPFRGLEFLLAMFPSIRLAVPETSLEVYSGMEVYQSTPEEEQRTYGHLYNLCRETAGVKYIGSVSQTELAGALQKVLILSYPNTFAETSCIAVMEAMAAGCLIVTSNLGALPETAAGFAKLVEVTDNWQQYGGQFIGEVVTLLRTYQEASREINDLLNRQVAFVNRCYTWNVRANEWENCLKNLLEKNF